ncbi:MAG TPA: PilZ domain-containing protein [Sphingomicrobium sp.]|jgi:hypothetical protein|nr:PilZ domain-containing protein [Sphingomicrobium sp.]
MQQQRIHGWVSRNDRQDARIDAVIHRTDGDKVTVTLTNLSYEGCRIEAGDTFRIGERVRIAIPRVGTIDAQVRWALDGKAGAQFSSESMF